MRGRQSDEDSPLPSSDPSSLPGMSPCALRASFLVPAPHRNCREPIDIVYSSNIRFSGVCAVPSCAGRRDSTGRKCTTGTRAACIQEGSAFKTGFKTGGSLLRPSFSAACKLHASNRSDHVSRPAVRSPSAMAAPGGGGKDAVCVRFVSRPQA